MGIFDDVKNLMSFSKEELEEEVETIKEEMREFQEEQEAMSDKEKISEIIENPPVYFSSMKKFNKYYSALWKVMTFANEGEYGLSPEQKKKLKVQYGMLQIAGYYSDYLVDYMEGDVGSRSEYGMIPKKVDKKVYWN